MRYSATLVTLLPMMGGLSALAMPAETVKVSKPTAAPYRPALMARDDPDMTYIGIGLNVTVEIDGKSKTCDSIADNDNCMFTLAPDKTDGTEVFISWPAGIPPYNLQKNNCTLMGTPSGGAEFMTDASVCWIRSTADGTAESNGVTFACAHQPTSGPCHQATTSSPPPY